ncbi:MAG: YcaO-like family protein [Gemmatimonadaceae bacterium]
MSVAVGLRARPIVGGVEPCSSLDVDADVALARAMMEGVERWCTEGAAHRRVVVGRWEDVPNALNPGALQLYSEEQYCQPEWPYRAWGLDTSMLWTEGFNALTEAPQMVPLETVTSVWPADAPPPICQLTSIGSAAHRSYGAAIAGALFELIERDAVMRWWYRLIKPKDAWSWPLPRDLAKGTLIPAARSVRVIDIGGESVVPVMLALVMSDDGTPPHLALGAGAAMTRGAAVRHAVLEAVGNIIAFAQRASPGPPQMRMHPWEHGQLYAWDRARGEILNGLVLPGRDEPPPEDLASKTLPVEPTSIVLARMAKRGLTPVIVDLTPPTLNRRGVRVVRAVVPQLIPMCFGLGQDRWGSFAARIAPWWRDRIRGIVHPFP